MIYFIEGGNYTKIGVSDNPKKRLNELQTGNPFDLKIKFLTDGEYEKESRIHKALSLYRVKGEWFYLKQEWNDELINFIIEQSELMSLKNKTSKSKAINYYINNNNNKPSISEISKATGISYSCIVKYIDSNMVINKNEICKEEKINEIQSVINQMKLNNEKINKNSVSEKSGASRTTVTKHWDNLNK